MRIAVLLLTSLLFNSLAYADWRGITSAEPAEASVKVISQSSDEILLFVRIEGFEAKEVSIEGKVYHKITSPGCTQILQAGAPDLPKITAPLLVPANGLGEIEIVSSSSRDFPISAAPSKGNLYRDQSPSEVPYFFGDSYSASGNYPSEIVSASSPYILRDFTGQSLSIFPFHYDHGARSMRVYHAMTLRIKAQPGSQWPSASSVGMLDIDFAGIYARHFVNFGSLNYTPLYDQGKMLIIADSALMPEMVPFVSWKNKKGQPTEMISVQSIGSTYSDIRSYVSNYYYNNGLTFLLLVGDDSQVPSFPSSSGDSDPSYGYVSGNDSYAEVIVGRFSATTASELATQIYRTLEYEQRPDTSSQFQSSGVCIASDQGPGDDNEMDYEHSRNMRQDLLGYGYQSVDELYDGTQGIADAPGSPSANDLQQSLNAGRGIMLYTGHGSTSGLGTTGFGIQDVAGLTNSGHLPFVWSVACVNGNFVGNTCLAEALLRAKDSTDAPVGALATLMSTINQSWDPPMDAQDEMVDILVESYPSNRRHTFGGISVNGCMHMNDQYGSAGAEITDTWTCFGDPSVVVRTATPHQLFVQHPIYIDEVATQFTPSVSDDGSLVCLSHNGSIVARGWSLLGSAIIPVSGLVVGDTLDVTATAYNAVPYHGTVIVTGSGTGIVESASDAFLVYPNPASDRIEIRIKGGASETLECRLVDAAGRSVIQRSLPGTSTNHFTLGLSDVTSGIYFLELSTRDIRTVKRVVVK